MSQGIIKGRKITKSKYINPVLVTDQISHNILGLSDKGLKISVCNALRALMEKVDNL
jgi:hypothetical protein